MKEVRISSWKNNDSEWKISVVDSLNAMESLSSRWNELLSNSWSDNVFLTWEWLYSWSEIYLKTHRQLFVLLIEEDGKLVGIAPWCIRKVRIGPLWVRNIEFLGTPEAGSDYLDVIVTKGKEKDVSHILYRYIFTYSDRNWDVLKLQDLPANSVFSRFFLLEFSKSGKYYEIEAGSFCPAVVLPQNVEEYDKSLSRNRRQQYQRHLRVLQSDNEVNRFRCNDKALLSKDALSIYKDFYNNRWEREEDDLFEMLGKLLKNTEKANLIDIDMLQVNGDYVGGLLHLNYNHVKYMYLIAVNKSYKGNISLGNLICVMNIKDAIRDKYREYDFLKGEENYKFLWMNNARSSFYMLHYKKSIPSLACCVRNCFINIWKLLFR